MVRVALADSNELSLLGLRAAIGPLEGVEIVTEITTTENLVEQLVASKADVLVIDYTAKNFGIESIHQAKECCDVKIVAITFDQMGRTIINAIKMGVTSYIKKDCDIQEIRDAVTQTAKNEKFFCGKILDTIARESIEVNDIKYEPLSCQPISLSERELEIIKLVAEGFSNTEIADRLFLSAHTVNTHRKNIMSKIGVNKTAAIVMYAVKNNLVSPNKFLFNS
jgi:DNA-binding NarL/FixJ family response regulator